MFAHIAGDYTLCHLHADLAFLATQVRTSSIGLPTHMRGELRATRGIEMYPSGPQTRSWIQDFLPSQPPSEQKVPDAVLLRDPARLPGAGGFG